MFPAAYQGEQWHFTGFASPKAILGMPNRILHRGNAGPTWLCPFVPFLVCAFVWHVVLGMVCGVRVPRVRVTNADRTVTVTMVTLIERVTRVWCAWLPWLPHMHAHTHTHTHTHIHNHACTHTRARACTHTHTHTHTCTPTNTYTHANTHTVLCTTRHPHLPPVNYVLPTTSSSAVHLRPFFNLFFFFPLAHTLQDKNQLIFKSVFEKLEEGSVAS